ncbi:MAG TPA: adenylate/guanylate cyclase domain-containing protein, partial [Verrucomicrobiae bacterium]
TTLYTTSRKVQATYQDLFERQFETQIEAFTEAQELRLEPVRNLCRILAQTPQIVSALQSPQIATNGLYGASRTDLDTIAGEGHRGPRQPRASYWGFLDARGNIIDPPRGIGMSESGRRFHEQMAFARLAMSSKDKQEIGYTPPPGKNQQGSPHEVIFTRVLDPVTKKLLGALVVGFPLPDQEQRVLIKVSQIMTGMLIGTNVYSRTIPPPLLGAVAAMVAKDVKATVHAHRDLMINVAGVPHRIFYTPLNEESEFPIVYQVGVFSLKQVRQEQADLRDKVLAFGAVMLLAALGLSLLLANGLAIPLQALVRATEEIQRENFNFKVPVHSRDELGRLAESFNRMAEGLALKDKYYHVLSMVTDRSVADELVAGQLQLGGETREVTVLFCDIRGFTALTQNMPPHEIVALLNEHMTALTRVVYEHHGVVDKYMGDMIMALFGAPKSYGDDAFNAVCCARRMIQVREELNQTSAHRISIGIGMATGAVVAGCMGSADRVNYTVLGDRVNLASRLSSQTRSAEVLLDQTTREKLGERVWVEPVPDLRLKGFSEPVHAFRLTDVVAAPAPAMAAD